MSEPENVATSSQSLVATGMIPQPYKSLLNRHAQNVWKQQPVYQTVYEGSGFTPKFRCTVMVDGVSYTSPDTFRQRKTAEMDASRIAYFDLLQKLKNEALCLVREDKSLYKLILVEFAAKMNMQKPAYQTAHLDTLHVFSSSLVFGDVSCTGDRCRSKKQAEQSAARAVILKYIDSESGFKLSEIIKSKYEQHAKGMGSQSVHSNANAAVQHGTLNGHSKSLETGRTHAVSTSALTSATPVPTVLAQASLAGTVNGTNEVVQTRTVNGRIDSLETGNIHEVLTPALTPAITAPTVLAESLLAGTVNGTYSSKKPNCKTNVPTYTIIPAPSSGQVAIPVTNSSNVVESENSEVSPMTVDPLPALSPAVAETSDVGTTSSKKRSYKMKIIFQKKMRADIESPVTAIPVNQTVPFSAQ